MKLTHLAIITSLPESTLLDLQAPIIILIAAPALILFGTSVAWRSQK